MNWIFITLIISCYGFLREFRPSEAYFTQYLTSPWKNLTLEEVNSEIYPWRTYSYGVCLIPVLLLTDYCRYKPMLIFDSLVYILTWSLLVWAKGIPAMTCMQVLYGIASAAEVGYFSYLYAMVDKKHFRKVTSIVRCAILLSKFVAYLVGQLFVSFEVMNLRYLNIVSFTSVCLAFCISLLLPKAKSSELHNKKQTSVLEDTENKTIVDDKILIPSEELHKRLYNEMEIKDLSCPRCGNKNSALNEKAIVNVDVYTLDTKTEVYNLTKQPEIIIESISNNYSAKSMSTNKRLPTGDRVRKQQDAHIRDYEREIVAASTKSCIHEIDGDDILKNHTSTSAVQNITENARKGVTKNGVESLTLNQFTETLKSKFQFIKKKIRLSYSSRTVMVWSLWWIFASYGNFQAGSYIQNLWKNIRDANGFEKSYNGTVEATGMLLGSLCVGLVCFVPIKWSSTGRCEIFMTAVSALRATIYVVISRTNFIWVAYVLYVCLRVINQVSIAVESAEIAKALPGSQYGFVFGCNMFLALVIESIFTVIVVDNNGFGVNVRTQFLVYGSYSFAMALVFAVVAGVTICRHVRRSREQQSDSEGSSKDNVDCDESTGSYPTEFITHL